MSMTELLQRILPTVQKPARYTGGEFNEVQKDPASVRVKIAYCFTPVQIIKSTDSISRNF